MSYKTVGIIIIGDEILKGSVKDENCHFLCGRLYLLGIKVCKISVIADDVDEIHKEVLNFSELYDAVITTGGIGPTHDDVTYEGIAKAFHQPLYINEEMRNYFHNYITPSDGVLVGGTDAIINNNCLLRIATIPEGSEVLFVNVPIEMDVDATVFPVVKIRNVFILPGVPKFTRHLFLALEKNYFVNTDSVVFYNRVVYLNREENVSTQLLNKVVRHYSGTVTFGSYPQYGMNSGFETKITIESPIIEDCLSAEFALLKEFSPSWIVHVNQTESSVDFNRLNSFLTSKNSLRFTVENSLKIIEQCFNEYDFSTIFLSFNGGKDCTVMLYLVYYVYQRLKSEGRDFGPLKALYSHHENAFEEEKEFVNESAHRYQLNLAVIKGLVKESLESYINNNPNVKVSFLGVRKSDPAGLNVKPFQITDKDWPLVVRVFPLLDWTYDEIWNFLRIMNIPYCSLYNYGYTSIGTKDNTSPNPTLRYKDISDGRVYYRPAYLLGKVSTERDGRDVFINYDDKVENVSKRQF